MKNIEFFFKELQKRKRCFDDYEKKSSKINKFIRLFS